MRRDTIKKKLKPCGARMVKIRNHLNFIFIFIFILVSCGRKQDQQDNITVSTINNINSKLVKGIKRINFSLNTPLGLGTIITHIDSEYGDVYVPCTVFAIDENTIFTNSHCLTAKLKSNPRINCNKNNTIAIKVNSGTLITSCKKIVFFTEYNESASLNDLAIIETNDKIVLDRYFHIDRNGVEENLRSSIWTLTHKLEDKILVSQFKELKCVFKSTYLFGKIPTHPTKPIRSFIDENDDSACAGVGGNSGSPVLTSPYNAIGIFQASYDPKNDKKLISKILNFKEASMSTIFKCIRTGIQKFDRYLPSSCPISL